MFAAARHLIRQLHRRRPAILRSTGMVATTVVLTGALVAPAWAGPGLGVTVNTPASVTVGQVLPAGPDGTFLSITNLATDDGFDTDTYQVDAITFLPSCGQLAGIVNASCPVGAADPDVIRPASDGVGRAGTACAGVGFTFNPLNDASGRYSVSPNNGLVALGPHFTAPESAGGAETALNSRRCAIDFQSTVIRMPTLDSRPDPGAQTTQAASASAHDTTTGSRFFELASGAGTVSTTVVAPPPPPAAASVTPPCTPPPGPAPEGGSLCAPTEAPPCTPPPGPAPPGGTLCAPAIPIAAQAGGPDCTPPPGPAAAGTELCEGGTATIRGKTGCAGSSFKVTVRGKQILRVVFRLDGRVKRTVTKPDAGGLWSLPINPRTMSRGVHRVVATTTFRARSATKPRTLRVTFSRCARAASGPRFTA